LARLAFDWPDWRLINPVRRLIYTMVCARRSRHLLKTGLFWSMRQAFARFPEALDDEILIGTAFCVLQKVVLMSY
jgi:hypothetical protein